jgi:hypothetical protein
MEKKGKEKEKGKEQFFYSLKKTVVCRMIV